MPAWVPFAGSQACLLGESALDSNPEEVGTPLALSSVVAFPSFEAALTAFEVVLEDKMVVGVQLFHPWKVLKEGEERR